MYGSGKPNDLKYEITNVYNIEINKNNENSDDNENYSVDDSDNDSNNDSDDDLDNNFNNDSDNNLGNDSENDSDETNTFQVKNLKVQTVTVSLYKNKTFIENRNNHVSIILQVFNRKK